MSVLNPSQLRKCSFPVRDIVETGEARIRTARVTLAPRAPFDSDEMRAWAGQRSADLYADFAANKNEVYETNRGLAEYFREFGGREDFFADLAGLGPGGVWLDVGAGRARAMEDFATNESISVSLPTRDPGGRPGLRELPLGSVHEKPELKALSLSRPKGACSAGGRIEYIEDSIEAHALAHPAEGGHFSLGGDAFNLEADEVVGQGHAPKLLGDPLGALAADGLLSLEHLRLHLVKPELQLPSLVVEVGDLVGRIRLRVQ
jgi:hypothetical protein